MRPVGSDPAGSATWPTRLRWSPLGGCSDVTVAGRRATALMVGLGGMSSNDNIRDEAATLLIIYLMAAAAAGQDMAQLLTWVTTGWRPGGTS
jgi:hypothetical protein